MEKRAAASLVELGVVLFDVVTYYEVRPHRSRDRMTPKAAYDGRDKMVAGTLINQPQHQIRHDVVDVRGHVTLRYPKRRHSSLDYLTPDEFEDLRSNQT